MGFVIKSRLSVGRTTLFGLPTRSTTQIGEDLQRVFQRCESKARKLVRPTQEEYPLKKLRSSLIHAMSCDVAFQPTAGYFRPKGERNSRFTANPIWDMAPDGAYYKARKLCSLSQPLVTHGWRNPSIVRHVVRLAINIWRMSKRHFDGLCRLIRSLIVKASKMPFSTKRKSPDAIEHFRMLSNNPILMDRVNWYSGYQNRKDSDPSIEAMLHSTKVGLARRALYLKYRRHKAHSPDGDDGLHRHGSWIRQSFN